MEEIKTPLINVKKISKSFSGVVVLKDVDFDVYPGEVHALIGENGAGKSTLVKVISGVHEPLKGEVFVEGRRVHFKTPHDARSVGIAMIYQEPLTFQDLNVTENIFLGHTRERSRVRINWRELYKTTEELLASLGVKMGPKDLVRGMSIADQQMIEITAALSQNAKVIIMDEPTAALSQGEVEKLFSIIRKLKQQGKGIIFIGHRLEEILEISDRVTVLRDGELVGECQTKDATIDRLVHMMVGRTFNELIVKEEAQIGEVLLETEGITMPEQYYDVSIKVRRGEIVGMAGLVGAGRSEVASAIFGVMPAMSGKIKVKGKEVSIRSVSDALNIGIAMVPEDRARAGLVLPMAAATNMTFAVLRKISKLGFVNTRQEKKYFDQYVDYLQIKVRDGEQEVKELSGGNQQKVVLAKWLLTEPDILILDEPTRGIDVGAKAEVYKLISELARQGKAILMISSEMQEVLQLSDRVYVMCEGYVTAELDRDELSGPAIMTAAMATSSVPKEGVV
jgi:rhamnose transport system ATP-binding protein